MQSRLARMFLVLSLIMTTLAAGTVNAAAIAPPGWHDYEQLATGVSDNPAVASWGPGRLDVFWVATDGSLQQEFYSGKWNGPVNLGGQWSGTPAVVSWAPGRIDVFGQGPGNVLQHTWYDHGWMGPEVLATGMSAYESPTVTTWGIGRLDVFWVDPALQLHTTYYNGSWHNANLGGYWAGSPTGVAWAPGRLDIFGRSSEGSIEHVWYQSGWQGPEILSPSQADTGQGLVYDGIAVSSWAPYRLDLFWLSATGDLMHAYYFDYWGGTENLGESNWVGKPAAISWQQSRIDLFGTGNDDSLQHTFTASTPRRCLMSTVGIYNLCF